MTAPKAVACLKAGFEDAMAVMELPEKYRKRLRSTNTQERLNQEIRRRERVIRIFPNDESALCLIGAPLAEHNETWQERRYLRTCLALNVTRGTPRKPAGKARGGRRVYSTLTSRNAACGLSGE